VRPRASEKPEHRAVDICAPAQAGSSGTREGAYFLQARLNISVPGVEREVAQTLVAAAHQTCPYSKAMRGNVEGAINVVSRSPRKLSSEIEI